MNEFVGLLSALTAAKVEFVVVGGTAAVLHGATTATYGLDVLMPFTRENCERLLNALAPYEPRLSHTTDKQPLTLTADQLVAFRNLYLSTTLGRLDVLGSLPPLDQARRAFDTAIAMDVGGLVVRVLALDVLIEVKAAMGRPKDKLSELELRAIAAAKKA